MNRIERTRVEGGTTADSLRVYVKDEDAWVSNGCDKVRRGRQS